MNAMKEILIEKVTFNVGCGTDQKKLDKALLLLKNLTKSKPVKTFTTKRIPEFNLRPGLPIGAKVTLRKSQATNILGPLLEAKDNVLKQNNFDENGNVAFGIAEYIDIPTLKYDPEIGIIGLQACITLIRKGFKIKNRKRIQRKVGKDHKIKKQEAIEFMKEKFKIRVEE